MEWALELFHCEAEACVLQVAVPIPGVDVCPVRTGVNRYQGLAEGEQTPGKVGFRPLHAVNPHFDLADRLKRTCGKVELYRRTDTAPRRTAYVNARAMR